jgi:hypothetical protein
MIKFYVAGYQNRWRWWPFSRILELAEGIDWSHVEIVVVRDDNWRTAVTFGSVFPRSRAKHLVEMQKHYNLVFTVPLVVKKDPKEALMDLAHLTDSKFYSFGQIFIIALRILTRFKLPWLNGVKLNLSRFMICTELVGLFMQDVCNYELPCSAEMLTLTETKEAAINNLLKD